MSKFVIIATHVNAGDNINGIEFTRNADGHMQSREVNADEAKTFKDVPHYQIRDAAKAEAVKVAAADKANEPKPETAAQKKARERLEAAAREAEEKADDKADDDKKDGDVEEKADDKADETDPAKDESKGE